MARVAYGMAIGSEHVTAEIIDWNIFRKIGRKLRVSTVPKTFINYGDAFSGTAPELSILERVLKGQ